jgi:predicted nucleic acid-binding protein
VGTVVIDASVVIATLDPADAHHAVAARSIDSAHRAGHTLSVPTSALAETLVSEARLGGRAAAHRRLDAILHFFGPSRVLDYDVAVQAAELRAIHRWLRLPDALVLATALVDDVDAVLTADGRWAEVDKRVRVI